MSGGSTMRMGLSLCALCESWIISKNLAWLSAAHVLYLLHLR
jgi:hypothetical protein